MYNWILPVHPTNQSLASLHGFAACSLVFTEAYRQALHTAQAAGRTEPRAFGGLPRFCFYGWLVGSACWACSCGCGGSSVAATPLLCSTCRSILLLCWLAGARVWAAAWWHRCHQMIHVWLCSEVERRHRFCAVADERPEALAPCWTSWSLVLLLDKLQCACYKTGGVMYSTTQIMYTLRRIVQACYYL